MAVPPTEHGRQLAGERREDPLGALPGLLRLTGAIAWRSGGWALGRGLALSRRLAAAAVSPEEAAALGRDARQLAAELVDDLIAVSDLARRNAPLPSARPTTGDPGGSRQVATTATTATQGERAHASEGAHDRGPRAAGAPHGTGSGMESFPQPTHAPAAHRPSVNGHARPHSLRAEGEELLRRSRDVHYELEAHPAYERILSELAPDEARILRLLLLDGPQPAVDVRTGGPLGLVRSRLIAPGISMIGARAGCRYIERVPSYLNNLFRLGLIWFSRETLRDHQRYQVLEAQPEVLEAMHSVPYAKIVRRSIHLTPFGEDFCRMALAPEEAASGQLPAHSAPPQRAAVSQPPE